MIKEAVSELCELCLHFSLKWQRMRDDLTCFEHSYLKAYRWNYWGTEIFKCTAVNWSNFCVSLEIWCQHCRHHPQLMLSSYCDKTMTGLVPILNAGHLDIYPNLTQSTLCIHSVIINGGLWVSCLPNYKCILKLELHAVISIPASLSTFISLGSAHLCPHPSFYIWLWKQEFFYNILPDSPLLC